MWHDCVRCSQPVDQLREHFSLVDVTPGLTILRGYDVETLVHDDTVETGVWVVVVVVLRMFIFESVVLKSRIKGNSKKEIQS